MGTVFQYLGQVTMFIIITVKLLNSFPIKVATKLRVEGGQRVNNVGLVVTKLTEVSHFLIQT